MNKNTGIIIGVLVAIVVAGGVYVSVQNKDGEVMDDKVKDTALIESNDQAMIDKDITRDSAVMKKDESATTNKGDTMVKAGSYETYAVEKIAKAETGKVVLFFRASWCPTCRALDANIKSHLSEIPSNLTILDVDYDNSRDLKQKYGVTYQHTLVQVDKDGNLIKKWSGSPTLEALVSEVQ